MSAAETIAPQIRRGSREFRRAVLALLAAGFSTYAVMYCTQPVLPLLAREFAVSPATSSLSLSVATGALAVTMLVAGPFSDARGRKPMMVVSLLASGVLTLLCGMAPGWGSLLAVRTLQGAVLAGVPAVAMAWLAEEMHPSAIGLAMGLYVSGNAIGGMSGRLITGVVADVAGWRAALVVTGVVALACAVVLWRLLPASRNFQARDVRMDNVVEHFAAALRDPGLPWLYLSGFLLISGLVTVYNYAPFRLLAPPYNLSQAFVGAIFALYVLGIGSSSIIGWLSGRVRRGWLMLVSLVIMLAGLLITLSGQVGLIVVGVAVLTFGFFGGHALASAWVGRRAGAAKASASALYLLSFYTGSSVMGSVGGVFWSQFGWTGVVAFVGVLESIALLAALRLMRLRE